MKPNLHIAMVLDAWDHSKNGAVISTKRMARRLRENGHKVSILTTGVQGENKVVFPGFYVPFARRIMERMKVPLAKPINSKLDEVFQDIDLIHVHFPFWLGSRAIKRARKKGVPVVSTFHIQAEHLLKNIKLNNPLLVKGVYGIFLKTIYNASDVVVSPSQFAEDELTRFGLRKPSVVISNGIPDIYKPEVGERPIALQNKFIITTVGRLAPEKNQQLIVKAIAASKHREKIQLQVFGEGPMKETLIEMGRRLPNPPTFNVVPSAELVPYYSMSDLYIHAAEVEVECMSAMEAMACGAPLLICDSEKSATKQFALDDRFIFRHNDVDHLRSKIDEFVENEALLHEAKLAYLEKAREYTFDKTMEKLERVYRELVDKSTQKAV